MRPKEQKQLFDIDVRMFGRLLACSFIFSIYARIKRRTQQEVEWKQSEMRTHTRSRSHTHSRAGDDTNAIAIVTNNKYNGNNRRAGQQKNETKKRKRRREKTT